MKRKFREGDIYLDCSNHPVFATEVHPIFTYSRVKRFIPYFRVTDWDLAGYSLFDGSFPRSCSQRHCAPEKIGVKEMANLIAQNHAAKVEVIARSEQCG